MPPPGARGFQVGCELGQPDPLVRPRPVAHQRTCVPEWRVGNTAAVCSMAISISPGSLAQGRRVKTCNREKTLRLPRPRVTAATMAGDENKLIAERRAKLRRAARTGSCVPERLSPRRARRAGCTGTASASAAGEWLGCQSYARNGRRTADVQRVMGKASFGKIADRTGEIQLYLATGGARRRLRGLQGLGPSATWWARAACCSAPGPAIVGARASPEAAG